MKRKEYDAYLHLIYKAFVEIRTISANSFNLFKPKTWFIHRKHLFRINRIADTFHNLPYELKSMNQKKFNKNNLWKKIKNIDNNNFFKNSSYEKLFKKILEGETRKILD